MFCFSLQQTVRTDIIHSDDPSYRTEHANRTKYGTCASNLKQRRDTWVDRFDTDGVCLDFSWKQKPVIIFDQALRVKITLSEV